jgi:hypothetical protein
MTCPTGGPAVPAAGLALCLARLAERAYVEATWRFGNGVEVLWRGGDGFAALAFRGTEDLEDALRDARGLPWPDRRLGFCHAGFLKGVREVWPLLAPTALAQPVFFTGHSKGGAEATLAAALTVVAGGRVAGLVTFGSPRVGFAGLGRILRHGRVPVARYVNGADCVPDHPWPLWGYRHVGAPVPVGVPRDRLRDHRMAAYLAALEDAAPAGAAAPALAWSGQLAP